MLYYLKRYPISLAVIAIVIYLSFFKPPTMDIPKIPYMDKLVHLCMYGGVSGMLWIEFLRNHRKYDEVMWHAWIGAVLCPIVMGGSDRIAPGILHLLPGWRLVRLSCQFDRGIAGHLVCLFSVTTLDAEEEISGLISLYKSGLLFLYGINMTIL